MGMRLILFFTVRDIKYLVNCSFCKLQSLMESKSISNGFPLNTRAEYFFWYTSIKFGHEINLKGLMFLALLNWRVKWISLLESFCKSFISSTSTAVVKTENLEEGFLRSFFSNFVLPVIENYDLVSCRKWDMLEEINKGF